MTRNTPASNLCRTRRIRERRKHSATARKCTVPDCPYGHYARGYCERHWDKHRRLTRARQSVEKPDA
jgi:hypothetical protein